MRLNTFQTFLLSINAVLGSRAIFIIVLPLALLSLLPVVIATYYPLPSYSFTDITENFTDVSSALAISLLSALINMLYGAFAGGAIVGVVKHGVETGKSSIGVGIGTGIRKLPVVLVTSLLAALIVSSGIILLILPGVALIILLFYFLPAIVIDGCGIITSFKKSFGYARNNLGYTVLLVLIFIFMLLIYGAITYGMILLSLESPWPSAMVNALSCLIFYPIAVTTMTVAYLNLK